MISSFSVFGNACLSYNNNMHEHYYSDRRSSVLNVHEHKKRKESNIKVDESKKNISSVHCDQIKKRRASPSYTHKKSFRPEFDDAQLFCDDCHKFYDNICPYHRQSYIPDRRVSFYLHYEYEIMSLLNYIRYQNHRLNICRKNLI